MLTSKRSRRKSDVFRSRFLDAGHEAAPLRGDLLPPRHSHAALALGRLPGAGDPAGWVLVVTTMMARTSRSFFTFLFLDC